MKLLRRLTLYNKNQIAYEDFLKLWNVVPNKYNAFMYEIDHLFVENILLIIDYSETKELDFLGYIMNRDKILPRIKITKSFYLKIEFFNNQKINAYKPWFFFEELFFTLS